jgi:hypothetical protein
MLFVCLSEFIIQNSIIRYLVANIEDLHVTSSDGRRHVGGIFFAPRGTF